MELRNFKYVALDADGKTVKGRVEAVNRMVCTKFLETKRYEVLSITEYKSVLARLNNVSIGSVLKPKHLVFFLKQLGALLNAGVKLLPALEILSLQQENRQHRKLYFEIYQQVYNGITFSHSLSRHPNEFPKLLVSMVEVGELSGELGDTIIKMALHYENQQKLTQQIKSAVRMPLIYLGAALLIATGMLLFVFPNMETLFSQFGDAKLPGITQAFINIGDFMANNAFIIFGSIAVAIIAFMIALKRSKAFHRGFSVFKLRVPVIGQLIQMNNQILIANTLAQMMSNGINSLKALQTVKNVVNNEIFKEVVQKTLDNIEDGKPFSKAFEESQFIDPIMAKMIATGERTGDIPKLMENLSEYYNNISEMQVEQLKGAIQPILLLLIYLIVGSMIMAIMLPMLMLGTQLD